MEKESAKIILSADSTCDLDTELKERYHVHYFPLHIILDGHDYKDGIDITPEEIFQKYYDEKILPKTAASAKSNRKSAFMLPRTDRTSC